MSFKLKGRHPISDKDKEQANDAVEAHFGIRPIPAEGTLVEKARAGPYELLLVDGKVFVVLEGPETDAATPTLRAIIEARPEQAAVTVDMGAVPHLRNGADVMSPGITEADPSIEAGDLVWVRDEEHGVPLAIGTALMSGEEMAAADSGKAITVWHYVGDDLWNVGAG